MAQTLHLGISVQQRKGTQLMLTEGLSVASAAAAGEMTMCS